MTYFQRGAFMNRITLPCQLVFASVIIFSSLVLNPSFAESTDAGTGLRFAVSFPREKSAIPLDGRILLMLSTNNTEEPRFQITSDPDTQTRGTNTRLGWPKRARLVGMRARTVWAIPVFKLSACITRAGRRFRVTRSLCGNQASTMSPRLHIIVSFHTWGIPVFRP
jgi:hypothetical protein